MLFDNIFKSLLCLIHSYKLGFSIEYFIQFAIKIFLILYKIRSFRDNFNLILFEFT
jgi:hypothetical protein